MSSTASWRTFVSASLLTVAGCASGPQARSLLHEDNFESAANWVVEAEQPARVVAGHGVLDIDAPAGITLWFKPRLTGPLRIEFVATAISAGGPNDQVSDLNVFWMASNRDGSAPFSLERGPSQRSGKFAEYNDLVTYYVGLGGNRNTTTRFRRYIGDPQIRPLLPQHDLSAREALLTPNHRQTITLIAEGRRIEYRRDGRALFHFDDPSPYVQGWFALRTTFSHLRVERLRIYTLDPARNSR